MKSWKTYALLAALCNASVGIFSKEIFQIGLSPKQIAFYKCLIAFGILSSYFLFKKEGVSKLMALKNQWMKIGLCSIFGIFILYHFETMAYAYANVSTVVFILLGSCGVGTCLLTRILLKEKLGLINLIATTLAIIGLFFMFDQQDLGTNGYGVLFSMIAGLGYGAFLTLTKKLNIDNSGPEFMWWFIGLGTLYLSIPFLIEGPALHQLRS